jgi:hypothetical protein
MRLREQGKEWFDEQASLRPSPMEQGDLALVRDIMGDINMGRNQKLRPRWKGPFRITRRTDKGTYILEELDGTPLKATYAGNRLKRFYQREGLDLNTVWTEENTTETELN